MTKISQEISAASANSAIDSAVPDIDKSAKKTVVIDSTSNDLLEDRYIYELPSYKGKTPITLLKYQIEPINSDIGKDMGHVSNGETYLYYDLEIGEIRFFDRIVKDGKVTRYYKIKSPLMTYNPDQENYVPTDEKGNKIDREEIYLTENTSDNKSTDGYLSHDVVIEKGSFLALYSGSEWIIFDGKFVKGVDESEKCKLYGITCKKVKALKRLQSGTRYILKTDAYLLHDTLVGSDVEIVLDGGNLYRYHCIRELPRKVTCVNGSVIDVPSASMEKMPDKITGMEKTQIYGVDENTSFAGVGAQSNCTVEYNMMDFVHSEDYNGHNNAMSIDLNAVLDRIFGSLYIDQFSGNQVMTVKMPETHFGHTSFFVTRPVDIPHNVTLDLSGARVFVDKDFSMGADAGPLCGDSYVFSFCTNDEYPNLATSVVRNAEIMLDKELVASGRCPSVVFNLTNFSGVMENVEINLNGSTKCVALWQPYGTPKETYSDRKIIRRCMVKNHGNRTDTPTVVLCMGDGCVIEQSNLGYVAIISGMSYTIRGCLNDSYFLYDSAVDFSGSHWAAGQFRILDSRVRFAASRLDAHNDTADTESGSGVMRYLGPWMAIDTEGCRSHLMRLLGEMNLGAENFNDIDTPAGVSVDKQDRYMAHVSSYRSVVSFDPSVRSQQIYWGYRRPLSGQLLKVGDGARIVGMENLESLPDIFIHNTLTKNDYEDVSIGDVTVSAVNAATIPLVNGDFHDLGRNVTVPPAVTVSATQRSETFDAATAQKYGCNWDGSNKLENIEARVVLDRKRKLYSEPFGCSDITPNGFKELIVDVSTNMSGMVYENLMVELTFKRTVGRISSRYVMRQHFLRPVAGDIISYGECGVGADKIGNVRIAQFIISKVPVLTDDDNEMGTDDAYDIHIPGYNTLTDNWGNMREPMEVEYPVETATKLLHLGEGNVLAYVSALPTKGEWLDGDQAVVGNTLYMRHNGQWRKQSSLA